MVKLITIIALMAGTAFAYDPVSSYSVTNNRELLNPEVSFTGQVGRLMRVTTYVKNGDTTPYDLGTNSVRAWITQADSGTNQTVTATIISASSGIVQYQWTPVLDGNNSAKLVAYAMANTTIVAQIAEHYVTVTPSAANIVSLSLNPLIDLSGTVGTPTHRWASGAFGDLSVGSLSVTGSISAIDTGAVKIVGSSMTGGLTNRSSDGFVGNGVNLTNLSGVVAVSSLAPLSNAVLQAVTNAGATINGSPITNGAAISTSSSELPSYFVAVNWKTNDYVYTLTTWQQAKPTNLPGAVISEYDPNNVFNTTSWEYSPPTSGVFRWRIWSDDASFALVTWGIGMYSNGVLSKFNHGGAVDHGTSGALPDNDYLLGLHEDDYGLTAGAFNQNPDEVIMTTGASTDRFILAIYPYNGSFPPLFRGKMQMWREGPIQ